MLLQSVMHYFYFKCFSTRFPCFQNFCTEHVQMEMEIRVEFIMHRSSGGRDFLRQLISQENLNSCELSFEMQDVPRNLHFFRIDCRCSIGAPFKSMMRIELDSF
jgi:hypothetical protein